MDDGWLQYKSVEKRTPGAERELYNVGHVITIVEPGEEGLWITQLTKFLQKAEGTDGMYMNLQWFYSRAQLIREIEVSEWEATSHGHKIADCEILYSDHIEREPNHVLNIPGRVLLASGRSEYAQLLMTDKGACHERLCRMFYNPNHSVNVDGLAFRFLEQGELQNLLRKACNSEIFYRPIDRRAAMRMIDQEAKVSWDVCETDEMEREEAAELQRVKRFVTKKVSIESTKLESRTDNLEERIFRLEASHELEGPSKECQEALL